MPLAAIQSSLSSETGRSAVPSLVVPTGPPRSTPRSRGFNCRAIRSGRLLSPGAVRLFRGVRAVRKLPLQQTGLQERPDVAVREASPVHVKPAGELGRGGPVAVAADFEDQRAQGFWVRPRTDRGGTADEHLGEAVEAGVSFGVCRRGRRRLARCFRLRSCCRRFRTLLGFGVPGVRAAASRRQTVRPGGLAPPVSGVAAAAAR